MVRKKRVMAKAKVYGFTPWVHQVDAINQIMKETGEKTESALLRKLVNEALEARRSKSSSVATGEQAETELEGRGASLQSLLMRLVQQGDISLRIQDVCLALLQDVLAEVHANRRNLWNSLVIPQLRDQGVGLNELEQRFIQQLDEAKNHAYGIAERIKEGQNHQVSAEIRTDSTIAL